MDITLTHLSHDEVDALRNGDTPEHLKKFLHKAMKNNNDEPTVYRYPVLDRERTKILKKCKNNLIKAANRKGGDAQ